MIHKMIRTSLKRLPAILTLAIATMVSLTGCKDDEPTAPAAPTVTRVFPSSGGTGETVSISGTGFSATPGDNIVSFNGTVGEVLEVRGDTALRVTVPADVTTGPVSVANRFSAGIGPIFTAIENPNQPTLTSLSNTAVEAGENIVIRGTNFVPDIPYRNIVKIGGINAPVSSVTATEIVATVPFRASGTGVEVTVSIFGSASNALPLDITPVDFHAFWISTPLYNISDMYSQFVMSFDSRNNQLSYQTIPDDSAATKYSLKYPLASPLAKPFPVWYDREENVMFLVNTNDNTLLSVNKGWGPNDFATVYDGNADAVDFTAALAITANPVALNELFIAAMDPSTGMPFVRKVLKDGTGVSTFSNGPFSNIAIHSMACSERYLYTLEGDPGNGAANSSIRMIELNGDGTAMELDPSRLPPKQLGNSLGFMYMSYCRRSNLLYFIYDDLGSYALKKLYSMDDAGTITLLNDQIPSFTSAMKILDTPTGSLLFMQEDLQGLNWYAKDAYLYVINLRSPGARPLPVQANMHFVPGHPETIISTSYESQYYAHTLMIDNE
jgi:hypothetical protein